MVMMPCPAGGPVVARQQYQAVEHYQRCLVILYLHLYRSVNIGYIPKQRKSSEAFQIHQRAYLSRTFKSGSGVPSETILRKASLEFERPTKEMQSLCKFSMILLLVMRMDGSMVMSASSWKSPEAEASTRTREGASSHFKTILGDLNGWIDGHTRIIVENITGRGFNPNTKE